MTYYDLLQVDQMACDLDIRAAYRRLAKRHHPDINPLDRHLAATRFRLIQEAYDQLRDPLRRQAYDQKLRSKKWLIQQPANTNPTPQTDAHDIFSSARRILEHLMRLMATSRDPHTQHVQQQDE